MADRIVTLSVAAIALVLLQSCGTSQRAPVDRVALSNAGASPGHVTVQSGDSLWLIAQREGITLAELIRTNGLKSPYRILPGQRLKLPRKRVYTVRAGDSLYGIAERYNLGRHQLARANGLASPYRIFPGQRLVLPRSPAPVKPPTVKAASRDVIESRGASVPPARPSKSAPRKTASAPQETVRPIAKRPVTVTKKEPVKVTPAPAGPLAWPVSGRVISRFGPKKGGLFNDGINLAVPKGTSIRAAGDGTVVYAGNELRGFGNLLLVRHGGGLTTAYAHNDKLLVQRGDRVRRGQSIAQAGQTGGVDQPQLHFEIRKGKRAIDPVKLLGRPPLAATSQLNGITAADPTG